MDIICACLCLTLAISSLLVFKFVLEERNDFAYFLIGAVFSVGVCKLDICLAPTAIDVYQGKTTLEIIYKDGVPVDSVVVFKTEKK